MKKELKKILKSFKWDNIEDTDWHLISFHPDLILSEDFVKEFKDKLFLY